MRFSTQLPSTHDARRMLTPLLLLAALAVSSPLPAQNARQQEQARNRLRAAHSSSPTVGFDDSHFTDEQRKQIYRLEALIMCACKKENWSKTLKGCPDGCADEQKQEVRHLVTEGQSDEAVLNFMVTKYSAQARAAPLLQGTGLWSYLFPFLSLGIAGIVVIVVMFRWHRNAQRRNAGAAAGAGSVGVVSDAEMAAVEKELEELE